MRALRSAAAVTASLALLIGVPWLLARTIGNPLSRLPDLLAGDLNDHVVLAVLAAILYLAWAQFAVAFAVELISAVRRTPMPPSIPGVFAAQQGLARALVGGALLLLPMTASTVVPAAQAIALSPANHPVTAVGVLDQGPAAPGTATAAPVAPTREIVLTDAGARTWWDLALAHLGDGAGWRDIWDLNRGRVQPDGTVLATERVVLQPGWTVVVPDATVTAPAPELPPAAETAAADDDRAVEVTVQPGDTLSEIAAEHGVNDWTMVWPSNAGREEPDGARYTDADYIEPGWTVTIPTPDEPGDNTGAALLEGDNPDDSTVNVLAGNTLSQIAADNRIPLAAVVAANAGRVQPDGSQLVDPDHIRPGWQIAIPPNVTPTDVTPADVNPAASGPSASGQSASGPAGPADAGSDTGTQSGPPTARAPSPPTPVEPRPDAAAVDPSGRTSSGPPSAVDPQPSADPTLANSDPVPSAADQADPQGEHTSVAAWVTGAALLAGGTLMALIRHRRRQFRYRRPGRSITTTPKELRDAERALLTAGGSGMGDVNLLDRALRGLTQAVADGLAQLPEVVAARLTPDSLELVLAAPDDQPPAPWRSDSTGTRWTLNRIDADPDGDADHPVDYYAPYPTLVSIGHSPAGEQWLLDLEHLGFLSLTGNTERCLDLARFIAAELAHNTWSDTVDVTLVGFGARMTALNPERLTHTDNVEGAAAAATRALADDIAEREVTGRTVLDARSAPGNGEVPAPHVTLLASAAAGDVQQDGPGSALLRELRCHPERAAVAVVFAGGDNGGVREVDDPAARAAGWCAVRVDQDGTLTIPALADQLIAHQLPEREAADLAALLALAADTQDHPMPASPGDQPWDELADAAGNPLLPPSTIRHPATTDPAESFDPGPPTPLPEAVSSALPLPPRAYFERTAADQDDLTNLAPHVPDDVRQRIENSDTDLDIDLADWLHDTTPRPRISVLGPIQVRAQGELPAGRPRLAWHTEVVTYLATRPRGATVEAFGTALWPDEPDVAGRPKLRNSIYIARKWLGVDPSTGHEYLPSNTRSGGGAYRVIGGLLDAELFRRLRLRGVARGVNGIPDLRSALDLVTGAPFDRQRPGGYGWLVDPALDHEYAAAIVDVAHLVATHHLAAGEPALAAAAARVALLAGSSADTPLLVLVAASEALGNTAEADAYVQRIMANHDAEVEEDLPPRTAAVLHRRRWLPPAA